MKKWIIVLAILGCLLLIAILFVLTIAFFIPVIVLKGIS